ncbi:hypothetical protein HYDPIDRAFT_114264 [Hydnomerulius pinastri MD-312]|uniref:Amino acid transporter transmembrane domain-containing protein n=1 Tax=Hydnomerulius pinastri MD-312 TaxID=994086 RepID=A0A0C9WD07_9AGAM|nr:hypothetical protein HYDPIDRAFT_114264 [Hydnomerulius pinastri MD-312]
MASGMPANRHRSSIDSPTSPYSPSGLSSIGSNSQLVLLPDTEDGDSYDEFDSDDEADDDNELGSRLESRNLSIPPLAPSVVFLYLLSPYLRLGAINIPDGDTPLKYGLASLVIATVLSAFCRHIWFLLGRYLRKSTTEDILVHTFARGRGRGRKHVFARRTITAVIALFRILMAAMYLRDSVGCVLPLVPETLPFRSHLSTSALLGFLVLVFSLAKSLAAKPTICLAGLSVASFLAWVITVSHAYATNGLQPSPSWLQRGVLWNEISSIIFACTTALTVPLSASLTGGTMVPPAAKKQRARSFQLLSTSSTALAALLMLPLVIFAASPRTPETSETAPDALISLSRAATLLLSVPSIILSIPSLPFPRGIYRNTPINPSKLLIIFAVVALSLVPPPIAGILNDAMLFLAVSGTFMLPALAHITIHYFRRPLSIVVPQGPSSVPSTPRTAHAQLSPPPSPDPLLQRKERLLQRSRLGKRLLWDIGIWIILIPICGCALVWAGGRLALQW